MNLYTQCYEQTDAIIGHYELQSKTNLWDAAYNIAIGQSVGNPNIRNKWETDELYEKHSCRIIADSLKRLKNSKSGPVSISFPKRNINIKEDGVSQLLCFLMGGHLDIDSIKSCKLVDIDLNMKNMFKPTFGIKGIRKLTGRKDKPLLGAIIKPKTGISPKTLLSMVKQLVEGGVDFIKEDEILGSPSFCTLDQRLKVLQPFLKDHKVIYCYCINGDYPYCIQRAEKVAQMGGNGVHFNVWGGLGTFKSIRELNLPLFIHFQKSGDKAFTSNKHAHHIDWRVICKLACFMGVDSIHAGMWGGYSSSGEAELNDTLNILRASNVLPALSCGMHPGIVNTITKLFGHDYMANVGGAIHGHPDGTLSGVKAMRQAIDGEFGPEYDAAIKQWGLKKS